MPTHDIVIIGAGHNGLVTAGYLAKAGFKPLLLERREIIGGGCVTEEIHPAFRCSTLAQNAGPLFPQIIKDLKLESNGLELIQPAVRVFSLNTNGASVGIYEDTKRTVDELKGVSAKDAQSYPEFISTFARIGRAISPLLTMTPPDIDKPAKSELWSLGKLGWAIRGLGNKDEYRLLRYGPPAGTDGHAIAPSTLVKGGMGWLTQALAKAATAAGAEIRTSADVNGVQIKDGQAIGVVLANGEEISARTVISNADPRATLLKLIDLSELDPSFLTKLRNYRTHGTVAKVNLALSALPTFSGIGNGDAVEKLSGRIHIGPDIDYLERAFDAAKYGDLSPRPYMDITIPSLSDSSMAPNGAHVMSIHAQFAPYKLKSGDCDSRKEELGYVVVNALSA